MKTAPLVGGGGGGGEGMKRAGQSVGGRTPSLRRRGITRAIFIFKWAGGAYVPTFFVGMYATLGMSMPSQHL